MTQLQSTETAIGVGSLKALFAGSGITSQPDLLHNLRYEYNLPYPDLPNRYSFDRYLDMMSWLRKRLYPYDSEALGYEKLGRNITQGYFLGMAGQVLKMSIGVLGVQRSVRYFSRVAGGALAFGEFKVVEEQPRYVRAVLYNVPGSPDIIRGMALESMKAINAKNPSVIYRKLSPLDTEFIARWEE